LDSGATGAGDAGREAVGEEGDRDGDAGREAEGEGGEETGDGDWEGVRHSYHSP